MGILVLFSGNTILGESQREGFANNIEANTFSFSVDQKGAASSGGGGGAGKAVANPAVFSKALDGTSPALLVACAAGTHFSNVVISFVDDSEKPEHLPNSSAFYIVTLGTVIISRFEQNSDGDGPPIEEITLSYNSIKLTSLRINGQAATGGWDFKSNRGI